MLSRFSLLQFSACSLDRADGRDHDRAGDSAHVYVHGHDCVLDHVVHGHGHSSHHGIDDGHDLWAGIQQYQAVRSPGYE